MRSYRGVHLRHVGLRTNDVATTAAFSPTGPFPEETEPIHLGFVVPDLLETFRRCQAAGAPILGSDVGSREPLPDGAAPERSFKVADPNGNVGDDVADPHHWTGVTL